MWPALCIIWCDPGSTSCQEGRCCGIGSMPVSGKPTGIVVAHQWSALIVQCRPLSTPPSPPQLALLCSVLCVRLFRGLDRTFDSPWCFAIPLIRPGQFPGDTIFLGAWRHCPASPASSLLSVPPRVRWGTPPRLFYLSRSGSQGPRFRLSLPLRHPVTAARLQAPGLFGRGIFLSINLLSAYII